MKKYFVKFNRTVESLETCEVTVMAENLDEALAQFNEGNWKTFLVTHQNTKLMGDPFIQDFKEIKTDQRPFNTRK